MAKEPKPLDIDITRGTIAKQGPKYLVVLPKEFKDAIESSGLLDRKLHITVHAEVIPTQ